MIVVRLVMVLIRGSMLLSIVRMISGWWSKIVRGFVWFRFLILGVGRWLLGLVILGVNFRFKINNFEER